MTTDGPSVDDIWSYAARLVAMVPYPGWLSSRAAQVIEDMLQARAAEDPATSESRALRDEPEPPSPAGDVPTGSNLNYGGPADCACGGGMTLCEGYEHGPDRCGPPTEKRFKTLEGPVDFEWEPEDEPSGTLVPADTHERVPDHDCTVAEAQIAVLENENAKLHHALRTVVSVSGMGQCAELEQPRGRDAVRYAREVLHEASRDSAETDGPNGRCPKGHALSIISFNRLYCVECDECHGTLADNPSPEKGPS